MDISDLWDGSENAVTVALVRTGSESTLAQVAQACDVPFYLPRIKRVRWSGPQESRRRRESNPAMFPGMIFIGAGSRGRDAISHFRRTHGNARAFGTISVPRASQSRLRDELTAIHAATVAGHLAEQAIKVGDICYIRSGPFEGRAGKIELIDRRGYYTLACSILGMRVPVSVPGEVLEKAA